jgi:hypothetical protein
MNNDLAVRSTQAPASQLERPEIRSPSPSFPVRSSADLIEMAKLVAASHLIPGVDTVAAAFTLMLICESEGLHPAQALKRYHIIDNRPSMRADAMHAEFLRVGGLVRWDQSDAQVCSARFIHSILAPEPGFSVTVTLQELIDSGVATTYDKEKKQAILKTNYRQRPRSMLRARCISEGVRAVCPGVVAGIYTPEEASDFSDSSTQTDRSGSDPGPSVSVHMPLGAEIRPAMPDTEFAAKVQASGQLGGIIRPEGQAAPVNYVPSSDPITDDQKARLSQLVKDVLKLGIEEWQAILLPYGVAKMGQLSAEDAGAIIRQLEAKAEDDDPFGHGAGDPGQDDGPASQGGVSNTAVPAASFVTPGTPRDDDPRVPLINEALAVVGRLGWDVEQLTKYLSRLDSQIFNNVQDIMKLNEQQLVYVRDDLKSMVEFGYGNGNEPQADLIVPDATRPFTKANAKAGTTSKEAKPAAQS